MIKNFALLLVVAAASVAFADDDFVLDPAPQSIRGVLETDTFTGPTENGDVFNWFNRLIGRRRSDLAALIGLQTPVKSQGGRGTCSIFSAAGEVESLLKIRDGKVHDLSENYLEYLVMSRVKSYPSEGSDTQWNIPAFQRFGAIFESTWPYETNDWTSNEISSSEKSKAQQTCGHLSGKNHAACLLSHMDPKDDKFADEAEKVARELKTAELRYESLDNQNEIRRALDNNEPLILGVSFFYKAWNHRKMEEYGLGKRNMTAWGKGIVSTPTQADLQVAQQHPAGHSIVIVGYDDAKRVYYFKNSWGTGSFGATSDLLGAGSTDGYGSITYDYAHHYGNFHRVYFEGR